MRESNRSLPTLNEDCEQAFNNADRFLTQASLEKGRSTHYDTLSARY
jgi:hypothetical protein